MQELNMSSNDDWTSAGGMSSDATILEPLTATQVMGSSPIADNFDFTEGGFPFNSNGIGDMIDSSPAIPASQSPE